MSTPSGDLFSLAESAGFPVVSDPDQVTVEPAAARMLPLSSRRLGVRQRGGVLEVLVAEPPTPSLVREISEQAGMLVTVTVTSEEVIDALTRRLSPEGSAPRQLAPALEAAVALDASDLHLAVGVPPVVRVDGTLRTLPNWPMLSASDLDAAARWVAGDLDGFDGELDRSVSFAERRWRVSVYRQRGALAMALRLIPSEPPSAATLGLPSPVLDFASLTSGLVLFCGPTGSGKSTSLAALIDRINASRPCHILTIEDPIEYVHADKLALVHQREIGSDTSAFATGLRSALRQDPDVLLVGELRDQETMRTALSAAETGHLVFATVHTNSTASAVTRIVASFPAVEQDQIRQQLAGSLRGVVFQVLLPATRGGRVLACEVLVGTSAVRSMIRDNRLHEVASTLDTSGSVSGMTSINRSLARLVAAGRVVPEVAEPYVSDVSLYQQFLGETPEHELVAFDPLTDLPTFKGSR